MDAAPPPSGLITVARIFWFVIGPAILLLLTLSLSSKGSGWFTPLDLAFLLVLAAVIFARWFEFRHGNAKTATGGPTTFAGFRLFVVGALFIGSWRLDVREYARQPLGLTYKALSTRNIRKLRGIEGGKPSRRRPSNYSDHLLYEIGRRQRFKDLNI